MLLVLSRITAKSIPLHVVKESVFQQVKAEMSASQSEQGPLGRTCRDHSLVQASAG